MWSHECHPSKSQAFLMAIAITKSCPSLSNFNSVKSGPVFQELPGHFFPQSALYYKSHTLLNYFVHFCFFFFTNTDLMLCSDKDNEITYTAAVAVDHID